VGPAAAREGGEGVAGCAVSRESGFTLITLLVALSITMILMGAAAERWSSIMRREREEELIFRGGQIADAIKLFQKKHRGAYPRSLKELVDQKFLRRLYTDPMTEKGQWNLVVLTSDTGRVTALIPDAEHGAARALLRIVGVASQSKAKSARVYNEATTYDKWLFTILDQGGRRGAREEEEEDRPGRRGRPRGGEEEEEEDEEPPPDEFESGGEEEDDGDEDPGT